MSSWTRPHRLPLRCKFQVGLLKELVTNLVFTATLRMRRRVFPAYSAPIFLISKSTRMNQASSKTTPSPLAVAGPSLSGGVP